MFCPAWARPKRARDATANTCDRSKETTWPQTQRRNHRRRAHRQSARGDARVPAAGTPYRRHRGLDTEAARRLAQLAAVSRAVAATADEMLADPDIDAVLICSSTDTHADLVIRAAQAGKHIFCEKPIDHGWRKSTARWTPSRKPA